MKIVTTIAVFFICTFSLNVMSQSYKDHTILLKTVKSIGNEKVIRGCGETEKYIDLKGIADSLKTYKLYHITFQPKQSIYQKYLSKGFDSTEYRSLQKRYLINELELSPIEINVRVYILSALINSNKQKLIICDSNNNHDFSDDAAFIYDTLMIGEPIAIETYKTINVKYDYYFNKIIHKREANIKIIPFNENFSHSDKTEKLLYLSYTVCEHKISTFTLNNREYVIQIPHNWGIGGEYNKSIILLGDLNNGKTEYRRIDPGLTIGEKQRLNEENWIRFNKISEFGDTLWVTTYSTIEKQIGIYKDNFVEQLEFHDIYRRSSNLITSDKYTILDFWGTWCGPCVAGLPKLKEFYQKHKSQIELVSIAHDKDIEKVKKFIEEKEMNWVHKFENNGEKNPEKLVEKLNVECFPTFILLDKSGKILSRGCGEQQLKEIEKILN